MLSMIKRLLGMGGGDLWIMIKSSKALDDDLFSSVTDGLVDLFEKYNLGELDGISAAKYQSEINFVGVKNFDNAKKATEQYFAKRHPKLKFVVSTEHENRYEKRERSS